MKILLDENVDNRLKDYIISIKGFSVKTTYELDLSGRPDREILSEADQEDFLILTHDDDFLSLSSEMADHASILYIPQNTHLREMKERIHNLNSAELKAENEIYFL